MKAMSLNLKKETLMRSICFTLLLITISISPVWSKGQVTALDNLYNQGKLKPIDSQIKVKSGQLAPQFSLPSTSGKTVDLNSFRGISNVVLSFIPAAWTPVCSDQWPGYNIVEQDFHQNETVLLGIAVDNIPSLYAWTEKMGGLWFDVLSDFWPHGGVAQKYGVLRSDGTAERALIFINKNGVITSVQVGDINLRPPLEDVFRELKKFSSEPSTKS